MTTAYGYGRLQYGPQLSSVTDALGQWIGYEFDAWGRMTQRSFYGDDATADAGELYHYDAWGRVDSFTDCNGAKTEFAYDLLGKLTQKKYYTGQTQSGTVEYAYNSAGQLASIVSDCTWGCSEQVHYSYDKLGRLQYRSGVGYGSISFQRDAMGRTKTLSWMKESEKQTSLSYSYDMAQRVVGVYQDNGVLPLASYSFDAAGAVETVMLENGAYVEYEYDETYGYLTALRNKSATGRSLRRSVFTTWTGWWARGFGGQFVHPLRLRQPEPADG
ncbi:RHS repeat protein [bacterium]|nr:RHS repeat protein [bacterium]